MARDIGPWTDLYSVGCIAYELFTGAPPFSDADTPMAVMLRHISEPLRPAGEIADVDPGISDWIARMTAKEPRDRPPSAAIAAEDLEELLLDALGPRWRREARLPEPPTARPSASRRRRCSPRSSSRASSGSARPRPRSPTSRRCSRGSTSTGPGRTPAKRCRPRRRATRSRRRRPPRRRGCRLRRRAGPRRGRGADRAPPTTARDAGAPAAPRSAARTAATPERHRPRRPARAASPAPAGSRCSPRCC